MLLCIGQTISKYVIYTAPVLEENQGETLCDQTPYGMMFRPALIIVAPWSVSLENVLDAIEPLLT